MHLTLDPALQPDANHHLVSERQAARPIRRRTPLSSPCRDLDRGTYTLAATVTDQATGESQSSDSVTFYVRAALAAVAAAQETQ